MLQILRRPRRPLLLAAMTCTTLILAGCATSAKPGGPSPSEHAANNDPLEDFNRKMWWVDMKLDHYLLRPIAIAYRWALPDFVQTGVGNVLRNLRTPTIMFNNLMQGDFPHLGQSTARLVINSVFGLGGMFDPATKAHVPFRDADFGQTLGSWGVDSGPYLVLPLLGPSDPRDGIGYGVDSVADPYSIEMQVHGYDEWNYARMGVSIVSDQAGSMDELDELERNSLDFYAAVRSLYQQRREAAVRDARGESGNATPPPGILQEEEPAGPEPSEMPTPSQTGTGKGQK